MKQLGQIQATCENADKGCTVIVSYAEIARHQDECDYATVKCTNYGCEAEMFQKDYASHQETCEFRVHRCDKCDVIDCKAGEGECIKNMAKKYEHLEGKLIKVSQLLDHSLVVAERKRLD